MQVGGDLACDLERLVHTPAQLLRPALTCLQLFNHLSRGNPSPVILSIAAYRSERSYVISTLIADGPDEIIPNMSALMYHRVSDLLEDTPDLRRQARLEMKIVDEQDKDASSGVTDRPMHW